MSEIKYEELVQEALINVVKNVLRKVSKDGMPGKHHFYISFRTDNPHVKMPSYLRESHPEEIMIVLQYQFWNLQVSDSKMSVGLSFGGVQEIIEIPFNAFTSFVDPSVKFGLKFTPSESDNFYNKKLDETVTTDTGKSQAQIISFDTFKKK